jgi:hypothetical protein
MEEVSTLEEARALLGRSFYTTWFSIDVGFYPVAFQVYEVILRVTENADGEVGFTTRVKARDWVNSIAIGKVYRSVKEAEMVVKAQSKRFESSSKKSQQRART